METNNLMQARFLSFYSKLVLLFLFFIILNTSVSAQNIDFDIYKTTLIDDYKFTSQTKDTYDPFITDHMGLVDANGQFLDMKGTYVVNGVTFNSDDINYYLNENRNLQSAFVKKHMTRIFTMVAGYISDESIHYQDVNLYNKIVLALQYWKDEFFNFEFNNFFANQIGLPTEYGKILILMEDGEIQLPRLLINSYIDKMAEIKQREDNGANSLDVLAHHLNRAALTNNQSLGAATIEETYFIVRLANGTTESASPNFSDGIKSDWSFQQHDAQMQTTTYGESFIISATEIFFFLNSGIPVDPSKLEILSSFIHNGYANGFVGPNVDWSVGGRHISTGGGSSGSGSTNKKPSVKSLKPNKGPLEKMAIFDVNNASNYSDFLERQDETKTPFEGDGLKFGNTQYFRSDYMTQRVKFDAATSSNEGYYASVRSKSTRVIGTENSKGQNRLGWHLSSGATYFMVDGDEYIKDLLPLMDWTKIPGITAVSDDPLLYDCSVFGSGQNWMCTLGETDFVGGVSDSIHGAAVQDYYDSRTGVIAKKSWFFLDNYIVCLGAGISANTTGKLTTSVNQVLLDGDVTVKVGSGAQQVLANDTNETYTDQNSNTWIHHDNIGYYFPAGNKLSVNNTLKTGKWSDVSDLNSNTNTQSDNTFQLWVDHGENDDIQNQSYSYIVAPAADTANDMVDFGQLPVEILENTASIQAVIQNVSGNEILQIVFHEATTYDNGNGIRITVDKPCVLMIKNFNSSAVDLYISDPKQIQTSIDVLVNLPGINDTRSLNCIMPTKDYRGSSVHYIVDNNTTKFQSSTVEFEPLADAYVRGGTYDDDNFGNDTLLVNKQVTNDDFKRESFLKFDLSSVSGTVVSAKLRMTTSTVGGSTNTGDNITIKSVSNDAWTESGIEWVNKPQENISVVDKIDETATLSGQTAEWDISSYIQSELELNKQQTSLHVSTKETTSSISFYSKDHTNASQRPVLVLEFAAPTLQFDSSISNGIESNSSVNIPVSLSSASSSVVEVDYTVVGTAKGTGPGKDYTLANGTLTIPVNQLSANISITNIVDDSDIEEDETIIITLLNPDNANLVNNVLHTYIIVDNDETSYNSSEDSYVRDGSYANDNYGNQSELIIKQGGTDFLRESFLKFDLSSVNGTVISAKLRMTLSAVGTNEDTSNIIIKSIDDNDDDWDEGTITWNNKPDENNKEVAITEIIGFASGETAKWDLTKYIQSELDEDPQKEVSIHLSSDVTQSNIKFHSQESSNAALRPVLVLEIAQPKIEFENVISSGLESVSSFDIPVILSSVSGSNVTVDYTVTGTATNTGSGKDYTLANGTLTISAGQSSSNIVISNIIDDTNIENDETVIITLSNPANVTMGINTVHTYTIVDNEASFEAVADTYVRDGGQAATNFGNDDELVNKQGNTGFQRESFLRFDLSSATETITSAKLIMTAKSISSGADTDIINLKSIAKDNWDEDVVIWNDLLQDDSGSSIIDSILETATTSDETAEWDVTAYIINQIENNKKASINVSTNSSSLIKFYSKEAVASHRPVLVLEYGANNNTAKASATKETLDIAENEKEINFNPIIYPNPVTSRFYINHSDNITKIEIIGIDGKLVKSISNYNQSSKMEVNMDNFTNAMYIARITDNNNNSIIKKLIKH
ncbi:DNRLRE domain-containing protein [Algibacter sp. AS12]|uniref:CBM96 family carbohydrate-binding protein n=1 Tax=Algibacter sp. AS12 TaxID=3135773 RepID=UPI00398A6EE5